MCDCLGLHRGRSQGLSRRPLLAQQDTLPAGQTEIQQPADSTAPTVVSQPESSSVQQQPDEVGAATAATEPQARQQSIEYTLVLPASGGGRQTADSPFSSSPATQTLQTDLNGQTDELYGGATSVGAIESQPYQGPASFNLTAVSLAYHSTAAASNQLLNQDDYIFAEPYAHHFSFPFNLL